MGNERGNILLVVLALLLLISMSATGYFYWQTKQLKSQPKQNDLFLPQSSIQNSTPTPQGSPANMDTITVKVFFNNKKLANDPDVLYCDKVFPVNRTIPYTQAVATAAINEWLKGPTSGEISQGYSGGTEGDVVLRSIKIVNGIAYVDLHFGGIDPNDSVNIRKYLSGTCGIMSFLGQLDETVKQFPTVTNPHVVYSIDGSREKFDGNVQNP